MHCFKDGLQEFHFWENMQKSKNVYGEAFKSTVFSLNTAAWKVHKDVNGFFSITCSFL
jgi:hypothetical protein